MDILARHQCICLVGETGNGIILMDNKIYEKKREKKQENWLSSAVFAPERKGGRGSFLRYQTLHTLSVLPDLIS